ncbi:MAG: peptidoglycan-binding protein [Kaiparowitsia implicata GSE-PSE-MK54-09C]|jgi:peptidoglycan hydrolase-like protein with peptidoglycan-binding domain|nr:peptidoglycan-binding protein [Kaiparowitsia implicata GSE-PSE-MK54-09C]
MESRIVAAYPITQFASGAIAAAIMLSANAALAQVYSLGSSGPAVRDIQTTLGLFPTGSYGPETEAAVLNFQRRAGLQVDGQAGPQTLRALNLFYLIDGNFSNVGGFATPTTNFGTVAVNGAATGFGAVAVVRTPSGQGINIRNQPNGLAIQGVGDGAQLQLTGRQADAGGRRWSELTSGGWAATEFLLVGGVGTPGGGYPSYPGGVVGGVGGVQAGPYVVVVPGQGPVLLGSVRRVVGNAFQDQANQGAFINAGVFSNRGDAENVASVLRRNGFDARVSYRTYL